jgi:hypothetical protein
LSFGSNLAPLQNNLSWSFAAFKLLLLDHAALEVGWLGFFIILKVLGFVQTGTQREKERERAIMSGGGDEDAVFLFCYLGGESFPISNMRFSGKWVFGFCRREMEVVNVRLTK